MGPVMLVLYFVGVMSCVFHLANGVWTMGITWGLWLTPRAQARANWLCGGLGAVLSVFTVAALIGAAPVDEQQAKKIEDQMYRARVSTGDIRPNDHKRAHEEADSNESARLDAPGSNQGESR